MTRRHILGLASASIAGVALSVASAQPVPGEGEPKCFEDWDPIPHVCDLDSITVNVNCPDDWGILADPFCSQVSKVPEGLTESGALGTQVCRWWYYTHDENLECTQYHTGSFPKNCSQAQGAVCGDGGGGEN